MYCSECGAKNPDKNAFCSTCGRPLARPPLVPAAPQAAAPQPAIPPAAPAVAPARQPEAPQAPGPAAAPRRNWAGITGFFVSLGSWVVYPVLLGIGAIALGILSIFLARRRGTKAAVTGILAIGIGLLAIVINLFWLDIFPAPSVLPPIK